MGISALSSAPTLTSSAPADDVASGPTAGTALLAAHGDHAHRTPAGVLQTLLTAAAPLDTAAAAAAGTALLAARDDHRHKIADTGWIAPTLVNAWENYGTFAPCGYRKIGTIVFLRGLLRNGSANLMFTLPAGYRPGFLTLFGVEAGGSHGRVDIDANGAVSRVSGGNAYIQMDLAFVADA